MSRQSIIYLIDLPTFPKGVISLSFSAIAACLPTDYKVELIDLNCFDITPAQLEVIKGRECLFVGLKVSSQNYEVAIELTQKLKEHNKDLKVIWGGEFPTLLPSEAGLYADAVVCGAFENIANELVADIENGHLMKQYDGKKNYDCHAISRPDYSIIPHNQPYFQSMGYPMETSRGCDKKCTFCMVHTMQPINNFKSYEQLSNELSYLQGKFINVIDYNIGSNRNHLNNVMKCFTQAKVNGWMGEMCLETLDDDELLKELAKSKCRIIYSGLESVSELSLKSINKAKTNNIENYKRIIKKAQGYGIQIAAGIIIGMEGANEKTIDETFQFYYDLGLVYAKITFLTYNPGTKVYESMKRVGSYVTEDYKYFDGNHLTFLADGVNAQESINAMIKNIKKYYSLRSIYKRAKNAGVRGLNYWEFIYFNICYRDAYLKWLKYGIFENPANFHQLMVQKFKKTGLVAYADNSIVRVRKKIWE